MLKRVLAVLLLAVLLGGAVLGWDFRSFLRTPLSVPESGHVFELKPGTALRKLALDLETSGVVSNAFYLQLLARWKGQASRLQAGEYRIAPQSLPEEFLRYFD